MLDCMYIYVVIIFLINKQRPKIFKFKDSGLLCTCKVPGQDHSMRIFVTKLIFIFCDVFILECKRMTRSHPFLKVFQNKVICKLALGKNCVRRFVLYQFVLMYLTENRVWHNVFIKRG